MQSLGEQHQSVGDIGAEDHQVLTGVSRLTAAAALCGGAGLAFAGHPQAAGLVFAGAFCLVAAALGYRRHTYRSVELLRVSSERRDVEPRE